MNDVREELVSYGSMTKGRPSEQRERQPRWRPSVFDFKSGGTCPTCQGTGRIPKGIRLRVHLIFSLSHLARLVL